MRQVTVAGVTYNVIAEENREQVKAKYPNAYDNMVRCNQVAYLALKRPTGRKEFMAIEYTSGRVILL
jgi:hypothetical protein